MVARRGRGDDAWRAPLSLPSLSPPTRRAIDAVEREVQERSFAGVVAPADSLRRSSVPVEEATGTLLWIALEQRVFAEIASGRFRRDATTALDHVDGGGA